ncbi:MAG: FKBP-type peptidyl-prolyl cis-trans isomerase [Prevotella sp.]|nr:FKBP-type peptidyl-prolyl cis-trans isomerase [Prevotella sp.]MBQ4294922.1 FKBP-type peptidyl-prolyl cis-trans isomerase [Prevotella sp.]
MDNVSYALGLGIGRQLLQMGATDLSIDDFACAIKDVLAGNPLKVANKDAQKIVENYFKEKEQQLNAQRAEQGKVSRKAGEDYLRKNATNEGVVVLPSGLQYKVLTNGQGKKPKATDEVVCHYEGFLVDGTVFDSSYQRGEPATFRLNQVITGWTEGLQLMEEGAKYRFFIPYRLGYGENGAGTLIPPYSTLIFDVELIKVN